MISKKEALILGVLAIGGVAVAASIADTTPPGDAEGKKGEWGSPFMRYGDIQGSTPEGGYAYQTPAQADVYYPDPPDYTKFFESFFRPQAAIDEHRGAAGVSSRGKEFSDLQISLTQPLFSSQARTFTPQASHPSSGLFGVTAPSTKSLGSSSAPIGTSAAQMPVYNPYVRKPGRSKKDTARRKGFEARVKSYGE